MHCEDQILLLGSQHGFQKIDEAKECFSLFGVKWGSAACSHPLNRIRAKVLASTYTEAAATGLNLFSDLPPVIQRTAAKTWGQLFCFAFFSLCTYPCKQQSGKEL